MTYTLPLRLTQQESVVKYYRLPAPRPLYRLEQFQRLGLSQNVLNAIEQLGFETPTDIQCEAIPHLLSGERDFIGLAQTGTGKTAAFGLPLIQRLDPSNANVQALVLAPTRELGQQIAQQIELFAKYLDGIQMTAVYGGANISSQISQLRKPCQLVSVTFPYWSTYAIILSSSRLFLFSRRASFLASFSLRFFSRFNSRSRLPNDCCDLPRISKFLNEFAARYSINMECLR